MEGGGPTFPTSHVIPPISRRYAVGRHRIISVSGTPCQKYGWLGQVLERIKAVCVYLPYQDRNYFMDNSDWLQRAKAW